MTGIFRIYCKYIFGLILFTGCEFDSGTDPINPSGSRLAQSIIDSSLSRSKDDVVIWIRLFTDGRHSYRISDYISATIFTVTIPNTCHQIRMDVNNSGEWVVTSIDTAAIPLGIQLSGVGTPKIDFSDFLNMVYLKKIPIAAHYVSLHTPLVWPILDTAIYEAVSSEDPYKFVQANSISSRLWIASTN